MPFSNKHHYEESTNYHFCFFAVPYSNRMLRRRASRHRENNGNANDLQAAKSRQDARLASIVSTHH